MRQHITVEQLQELTPEQAHKLYCYTRARLWQSGDFISEMVTFPNGNGTVVYQLARLSIGQCIELLGKGWIDAIAKADYHTDEIEPKYDGELIDALWETVKEVL